LGGHTYVTAAERRQFSRTKQVSTRKVNTKKPGKKLRKARPDSYCPRRGRMLATEERRLG
jgi:hypothetical protein